MRGWYIPFCMLNVIICTTYFRKDSFRAWTTTKTCILLNVLIEIAKLYRFWHHKMSRHFKILFYAMSVYWNDLLYIFYKPYKKLYSSDMNEINNLFVFACCVYLWCVYSISTIYLYVNRHFSNHWILGYPCTKIILVKMT
jgi:hypothetical protein